MACKVSTSQAPERPRGSGSDLPWLIVSATGVGPSRSDRAQLSRRLAMPYSPRLFAGALLAAALSFPFHTALHAQPASNATGDQQVVSPEVTSDRRVTLRLF